jgi:hypothetical protein
MVEKRKMLMDAETDRCIQLASGFLILAEKELSAFIRAVDKLFGAKQARNRRWIGSRNWDGPHWRPTLTTLVR